MPDKIDERLIEIGKELAKVLADMGSRLQIIGNYDDELKLSVSLLDFSALFFNLLKGPENTAEMLYVIADLYADKVNKPKWEPSNG